MRSSVSVLQPQSYLEETRLAYKTLCQLETVLCMPTSLQIISPRMSPASTDFEAVEEVLGHG